MGDGHDQISVARFKASVTPDVVGTLNVGRVQFYDDAEPGVTDLSTPLQTQYKTCTRCVLITAGETSFFQLSGSIDVKAVDFDTGAGEAVLTDVKLVEVTIDEDSRSSIVPNGRCVRIATAQFDVLGD